METLPTTTATRVSAHTARIINERIRAQTLANIQLAGAGGHEAINRRLEELDREWDVERGLEATASSLTVLGAVLGLTVNRKWLLLPLGVGAFLLQHAVQGWCPPIPVLRRLGVRTADEINQERYALKALRGDFVGAGASAEPEAAARAVGLLHE